jgi:hypothetical protein
MEDALKEKLTRVLNSPIETEERVVYFFVELRKLMERTNTKKKYPAVNLYCNWVVHTKLSQSALADEIVRQFDLAYGEKPNPQIIKELNDLLTTARLKKELNECLHEFDLPALKVSTLKQWNSFRHSLAMVITDCPLNIRATKKTCPMDAPTCPLNIEATTKSAPPQFIECVTVAASVEENGMATVAWQITRKGEQKPTAVASSLILR